MALLIIIGVVLVPVFADSNSSYDIQFNGTGVTSTYRKLIEKNIAINDNNTATKTYIISLQSKDDLTIKCNTSMTVPKSETLTINAEKPAKAIFKPYKNDDSKIVRINQLEIFQTDYNTVKQKYGASDLDADATEYFFIYLGKVDDDEQLFFIILIEITKNGTPPPSSSTIDPTALETAISDAPDIQTDTKYHHDNDRFNGKVTSTNGFWADMQSKLTAAQSVYANVNNNATQTEVENAASALQAAISNLIPVGQINATDLYEAIHTTYKWSGHTAKPINDPQDTEFLITADNTTEASWSAYQTALTTAQAELAKLFYQAGDTLPEGKKVGDATPYNDSKTGDAADNVQAALTALNDAVDDLDQLLLDDDLDERRVNDARMAYDGLATLANRIFNPAQMDASRYTQESWDSFLTERENALTFYNGHAAPALGTTGYNEAQTYLDAYTALWNACCRDLTEAGTVSATVYITDVFALRNGLPLNQYVGVYEFTGLAADNTLAAAMAPKLGADWADPRSRILYHTDAPAGSSCTLGVFVNGVYVFSFDGGNASAGPVGSRGYADIRLHNGDTVVLAIMEAPTYVNMSNSQLTYTAFDALGDVQYLQTQSGNAAVTAVEATAGESLDLRAAYSFALPNAYSGGLTGLSGVSVYASERCDTREDAMRAVPSQDTGVVSGTDGGFSLSFYGAGWYTLGLVSGSERGGLANGPLVLVHVTEPEDLSGIRAEKQAELDAVYYAYGSEFYTSTQATQLEALYRAGTDGIEKGANSGAIYTAAETAISGIKAIQTSNEKATDVALANARFLLNILPTVEQAQAGLIWYEDGVYLEALVGENGIYTNMTEYQRSLLLISEIEAIEWFRSFYADPGAAYGLADDSYSLSIEVRDADTDEPLTLTEVPLQFLQLTFDRISELTTDEDGYYRFGITPVTGDQTWYWAEGPSSVYGFKTDYLGLFNWGFRLSGDPDNSSITNGYEIVRSSFSSDLYLSEFSQNQYSGRAYAYPLREDVVLTVYVRSVNNPASSYLALLYEDFSKYDKADYTPENWSALLDEYANGKAAIKAAGSDDERQAALVAAKLAMSKIDPKPAASAGDVISKDGLFNAGKQVGTVTVTVENTTFPGGAFPGNGETGVILSKTTFPLGEKDTMMTVILRALADDSFTWNNGSTSYSIEYLAYIEKEGKNMGQFSGETGSGWMGTLNGFMVNEGFPGFTVLNGMLGDGDTISLMFTQNLGVDLGGTWSNSDTTLKSLGLSTGTLLPEKFAPGEAGNTYDYALLIPGNSASIRVTTHANNINYMVKTFLNEKVTNNTQGNSYYRPTEEIPVHPGDVIWVGCGEYAWPSMNNQGAEARLYTGTWYALHVISPDTGADYVNELIAALPAVKNINSSNTEAVREQIKVIDAVIAELSASERARVNSNALEAVREVVTGYETILSLQAEIAALPKIIEDTKEIKETVKTYNSLSDSQKSMLTLAEKNKIENTAELLAALGKVVDKDFFSVDVDSKGALNDALVTLLQGMNIADSVSVEVSSYKDAVGGEGGSDGSYSATVTIQKGNGMAKKTISGEITRNTDVSVNGIVVNVSTNAAKSETEAYTYEATLPYGSDLTTANFTIDAAKRASSVVTQMKGDDGSVWIVTVTAENVDYSQEYIVKLKTSEVKVTVLDSNVYDISDDTVVTSLSPVGVSGLNAIVADSLDLPEGTKEASVWLMLKIKEQSDDKLTLTVTAWYAADCKEADRISDEKLEDIVLKVTVPLAGTEYAKVLYGGKYLDAKGSKSGIEFAVSAAGDYTLIPDASLVKVTFHLNGGTSTAVKDGQQIVYFPEDVTKGLPLAAKEGAYSFEGWFADKDGTGKAYTVVSKDLPTDLYALWKSLEEDVEVIEYIDKKKVSVDSVLEDDGTAVVTVKSAEPCVVILKDGDSYVPLKAVKDGDSYVFSQKDYKDSMVFIVTAKGDFDKDGDLDLDDFTAANKAIVGQKDVEPLQLLVMGANGKKLKTVDLAKLYLHLARNDVEW